MSILGVDGMRGGVLAAIVSLSMGSTAYVMAQEPNSHEHGSEHEQNAPGEHGRRHDHEHDEEAFALQEIIVTPEKRAENLQSTPLAVAHADFTEIQQRQRQVCGGAAGLWAGSLATRNFATVGPPRTYGVTLQVRF